MKSLIVYDSQFGNTEKIAQAIGDAITGEVKMLRAKDATLGNLTGVDLLIVGSPTQGGRATPAIQQFLASVPSAGLGGIQVAAFDTRLDEHTVNFFLKLLMQTIGYAAPKIAKILEKKGGRLAAPPEGFIVTGKEGPLENDEFDRATDWADRLQQ